LTFSTSARCSLLPLPQTGPFSTSLSPIAATAARTVVALTSRWSCSERRLAALVACAPRNLHNHSPNTSSRDEMKLDVISRTARNRRYRACLAGSCTHSKRGSDRFDRPNYTFPLRDTEHRSDSPPRAKISLVGVGCSPAWPARAQAGLGGGAIRQATTAAVTMHWLARESRLGG
jgi:hypothetical protein